MKFTKHMFGTALARKLKERPFDIVFISRWCSKIYSNYLRDFDEPLRLLIFELSTMDDDPQFEYSENELHAIAERLIKEGIDEDNGLTQKTED